MKNTKTKIFLSYLRSLKRLIDKEFKKVLSCSKMSLEESCVLIELKEKNQSVTELSKALCIDKSNLSRILNNLIEKGFVKAKILNNDKRKKFLILTRRGEKKLESINKKCDSLYKKLFENIPEEKLTKIIESISLISEFLINFKSQSKI